MIRPDRAHHDLAKFLGHHQAPLRTDGVGELLALGRRFSAHLARRVHGVLRFQRGDDLGNRYAQLGQLIGFHPNAHGVLAAEHLHAPHPGTREFIHVVDVSVIGQKVSVVCFVG